MVQEGWWTWSYLEHVFCLIYLENMLKSTFCIKGKKWVALKSIKQSWPTRYWWQIHTLAHGKVVRKYSNRTTTSTPIPSRGHKTWDSETHMRSLSLVILRLFSTFPGEASDSNFLNLEVNFLAITKALSILCSGYFLINRAWFLSVLGSSRKCQTPLNANGCDWIFVCSFVSSRCLPDGNL